MFKEAFKVTNNSIILAIPMIICLKIVEIYTQLANSSADSNAKVAFATLTLIIMIGAFCAGFFYMVKKAIEIHKKVFVLDSDRHKEHLAVLKKFTEGISKYFLSFAGFYILSASIQILLLPLTILFGVKLFGDMSADLLQKLTILANDGSTAAIGDFVNSLTDANLSYLGKWILLFLLFLFIVLYFFMLWIPEILYNVKNPFIALFTSIKKLLKDFWKTFGLYILIYVFVFVLAFIMTYLPKHPLSELFFEVTRYYFYLYFIFLIFIYYDKKYNTEDKPVEANDEE